MSQLRAQDRLQPALLDRLTDDAPDTPVESAESRVINRQRLRALVLRDLEWLFNTASPGTSIDWSACPEARRSGLNYGLPPLSGMTISGVDLMDLQQMIRQAILAFEPRILPEGLEVQAMASEALSGNRNQLAFRIVGQLWAQPLPMELMLHTSVDLDTGRVEMREVDH